jgi:predicted RNase H-like HicB family nuclease
MILDLIVRKEIDGFSAKVPSLQGVETWAHTEDDALDKILDMLVFYFNLSDKKEISVDRTAKKKDTLHYKLIFGGTHERVFD